MSESEQRDIEELLTVEWEGEQGGTERRRIYLVQPGEAVGSESPFYETTQNDSGDMYPRKKGASE